MEQLLNLVRTVAPSIASAVGGPLAGMATKAISEALLGKPDGTEEELAQAAIKATPEQLLALKKAENDFALQMRELDIDLERIAGADRDSARNREIKKFLYENMYRHYRVVRMQEKAEAFLGDLFRAYVREPAQLPPEVQRRAREGGDLHRSVCDYIAGMTDRFALDEHAKLFDPHTRP